MLVLSGGKYDSYCPNRGRLERREAGEENLEVGFHLQPVPFMVFFLSLPVTPEAKWLVSRVLVSLTHYPLVFLRHESTGKRKVWMVW